MRRDGVFARLSRGPGFFLAVVLVLGLCAPVSADDTESPTEEKTPISGTPAVAARENGHSGFLLTAGQGLSVGTGGSVSESPYKQYGAEWMPLPLVFYEGDHAYLRGTRAGLKLVNRPYVELSVFGGYDATAFDASDSSHQGLRRLKNRHSSAEAGAEIRVLTPVGMLHADGARDVLGRSNGFRGTIGYANSWESGPFEIAPCAGIRWSSAKYDNYYYGVDDKEARRSGLDAYDARGGASPFIGLTLSWDVVGNWGIFWSGETTFLSKEVRNSPMVGKSRVHAMTFGIMYGF